MYNNEKTIDQAIKFVTLTNWLKNRLENHKDISKEEIKEQLIALEVEVNEKIKVAEKEV